MNVNGLRRDQIGRIFKLLATTFSYKSSPENGLFGAILKHVTYSVKTSESTFWATFVGNWATS